MVARYAASAGAERAIAAYRRLAERSVLRPEWQDPRQSSGGRVVPLIPGRRATGPAWVSG
jgi:hypothetical protein